MLSTDKNLESGRVRSKSSSRSSQTDALYRLFCPWTLSHARRRSHTHVLHNAFDPKASSHTHDLTLLLRGRCDSGLLEDKRTKLCHLARVSANSVLPFALSASSCSDCIMEAVTSSAASAWLQPMGSAPIIEGNGAFLGIGAGFTGTIEAELDDAGCGCIDGAAIDDAGGQPCGCIC